MKPWLAMFRMRFSPMTARAIRPMSALSLHNSLPFLIGIIDDFKLMALRSFHVMGPPSTLPWRGLGRMSMPLRGGWAVQGRLTAHSMQQHEADHRQQQQQYNHVFVYFAATTEWQRKKRSP